VLRTELFASCLEITIHQRGALWGDGLCDEDYGEAPGGADVGLPEDAEDVGAVADLGFAVEVAGEVAGADDLADERAAVEVEGDAESERGGFEEVAEAVEGEETGLGGAEDDAAGFVEGDEVAGGEPEFAFSGAVCPGCVDEQGVGDHGVGIWGDGLEGIAVLQVDDIDAGAIRDKCAVGGLVTCGAGGLAGATQRGERDVVLAEVAAIHDDDGAEFALPLLGGAGGGGIPVDGEAVVVRVEPDKDHVIDDGATDAEFEVGGVETGGAGFPMERGDGGNGDGGLHGDSQPSGACDEKERPCEQRESGDGDCDAGETAAFEKMCGDEGCEGKGEEEAEYAQGETHGAVGRKEFPHEALQVPEHREERDGVTMRFCGCRVRGNLRVLGVCENEGLK